MKKILSFLLILLLLCALAIPALAAKNAAPALSYVTDDAAVFSSETLETFETVAETLSDTYKCGVYFITLDDYTQIAEGEPYDVAEAIYDAYQLGYGEKRDGVLMMVSVAEGNCALISQGSATAAIGDAQLLLSECVDAYGSEGYADICSTYFGRVAELFSAGLAAAPAPELQTKPEKQLPAEPEAEAEPEVQYPVPELDGYVTDLYGLLTAGEEAALEIKAAELSGKYGCGVYILIVDDYTQYGRGDAYTVAGDVFLACDLGEGYDNAGVLLMMSMDDRDVTIITNETGHYFVSADAKDWLAVKYLKEFRKNDWAKGYDIFLTKLDTVLKMAANGKPMTWTDFPESIFFGIIVSIIAGFGISYLILDVIRGKMRSVFKANTAEQYITPGGVNIRVRTDDFLRRTTTRRKIQTQSSSGSSGSRSSGSRSTDSRGFSGRSDKF